MKVLLVSSRSPWPPYTGDRLRAQIWIEALAEHCELTLVSPGAGALECGAERRFESLSPAANGDGVRNESGAARRTPKPPPAAAVRARMAPVGFLASGVRAITRGLPLHCVIAAGYGWGAAIRRAEREHGPFDAAVVLLSRVDPWIIPHLRAKRLILDAVDSLTLSMRERARAASAALRPFWNLEERRTGRLERELVSRYDRIVVVNESERELFGDRCVAVPNGVAIHPLNARAPRSFDFGFWGNLGYFANRDALELLLAEIWPAIRRSAPGATLMIGGADAPRAIRRLHGREGIAVISPIEDRPALLRLVRVALLPLRHGTGQSNKVLEAAEAGCAIAGTPAAVRGFEALRNAVSVCDAASLADGALEALASAQSMGSAARAVAEGHYDRTATLDRLRSIAQA